MTSTKADQGDICTMRVDNGGERKKKKKKKSAVEKLYAETVVGAVYVSKQRIPSLRELCVEAVARHKDRISTSLLKSLDQRTAVEILILIMNKLELTPKLARVFSTCGHPKIEDFFREHVDQFRGISGHVSDEGRFGSGCFF